MTQTEDVDDFAAAEPLLNEIRKTLKVNNKRLQIFESITSVVVD
jgi:hypothetical protein